ncbi:MAG: alpha/beta hydrolase family protein [Chthoniobacteraceae bacterium]
MAFLDVHCFSDTLGLNVSFYVLLPQNSARQIGMVGSSQRDRHPTLYLLHGLSDDHTIWMRRTSIERYAAARGIAVVMPAVARSYYQDMASGPKYWTFLSEELPAVCQQWFPLSSAREDTFAAGLSMGGYGALRLGLAHPEKFAAVASLSGALDLQQRLKELQRSELPLDRQEWTGIFGEPAGAGEASADLFQLADKVAGAKTRPKVYLCCGTEDYLLGDSRAFHHHLDRHGIAHTYEESSGTHEWGYWDRQIQQILAWLPLRG